MRWRGWTRTPSPLRRGAFYPSDVLRDSGTLRDGETIGFFEADKHSIARSEGVSLRGWR